eukprot:jgi/Chlat1/5789/Chrsp387S05510
MARIAILAVLLLATTVAARELNHELDWHPCGEADWKVKHVAIKPYPVPRAENFTAYWNAVADRGVEKGGEVTVRVEFHNVPVKSDTIKLQDFQGIDLPVKAGQNVEFSHTIKLPAVSIPGKYTLHIDGKTEDRPDVTLFCVEADFDVVSKSYSWGDLLAWAQE